MSKSYDVLVQWPVYKGKSLYMTIKSTWVRGVLASNITQASQKALEQVGNPGLLPSTISMIWTNYEK